MRKTLDLSVFDQWIRRSPSVEQATKKTAERFVRIAIEIFNGQVIHSHPITNPAYTASFKIQRVRDRLRKGWAVTNTDPAAVWVEFGAHAGGVTKILGYRVFGKTIDTIRGGG